MCSTASIFKQRLVAVALQWKMGGSGCGGLRWRIELR